MLTSFSVTRLCLLPVVVTGFMLGGIARIKAEKEGGYDEPIVTKALFAGEEVAILAVDRDKLATNIAAFVVNSIKPDGKAAELDVATRLIGLALHLNPRNRIAVVANFQFKKGLSPKKVDPDYSPVTLAEVLQNRAVLLARRGGDINLMLAGYLLAAAVDIDPMNESAIYELEMYRKAVAEIDWTPIVGRVRSGTARSGS
ncbi:MAG: hypothetical protein GY899_06245 [Verrucomicrobiaceae bacterium]|nr:hypothetical protein [Verrucomicrobiaceae bacterium]